MRTATRFIVATMFVSVAASCGDTGTSTTNQLNLDRPVDVAFACYGGLRITGGDGAQPTDPLVVSTMPRKACDIRSISPVEGGPSTVPVGQEDLSKMGGQTLGVSDWYGLILESSTGSVALAQFAAKPTEQFSTGDVTVLDTDPLTPGKNGISVGIDPIAITVDDSGCFAVTANAGSCDVSVLDLNSAFQVNPDPKVTRLTVKNARGESILARPSAMVAATTDAPIGQACPATQAGLVYIAYPSCHLVAAVDTATMTVVAGITFDTAGAAQITDGNVSCPSECGGGGTLTAGARPGTIAIRQDERVNTRRLAIGADNVAAVTMVELNAALRPTAVSRIALEDPKMKLGITSIALSPQIGMGGSLGVVNDTSSPGGQAQYVYAVANDASVRVVDVLNVNKECDTQVDPRKLSTERSITKLSCLPVGDPTTPSRRATARSPGIELTGEAAPTSVAFFKVDSDGLGGSSNPDILIGHFAAITASTGATFIVNVDDDDRADLPSTSRPIESPLPLVLAHQLRDALLNRNAVAESTDIEAKPICNTLGPNPDDSAGNRAGPRMAAAPAQVIASAIVAAEKSNSLPAIRQLLCEGSDDSRPVSQLAFSASVDVRASTFPDLRALRADETWSLTYEGSLSLDRADIAIDGPPVRIGLASVKDSKIALAEPSKPFCAAGVEPFDIVTLRGCDPTAAARQCGFGFECVVHPDSVNNVGVCLQTADKAGLTETCRDYMIGARRFAVAKSTAGELSLMPRLRQLRSTPTSGCTSNQQCTDLALVQAKLTSTSHPVDDRTPTPTSKWTCEVDPSRASTAPACVMTCNTDSECDSGTLCRGNRCVEAVVPPAACLVGPQRFDIRASGAFTVVGTRSGYLHNMIADTNGACIQNPAGNPLLHGRIPLSAPPCTSDELGTPTPNPCQATVKQTERKPQYLPNSCIAAEPATVIATRDATAIRFANPGLNFSLVDPTYPGDAVCRGDRAGSLLDVPRVYAGYAVSFRQTAGFAPLILGIRPAFPVKAIAGPAQSIWVVDEGDFLSDSGTAPSTRGKVFKVEAQSLTTVNVMQ
jgi:hypothetical protein